MFFDIRSKQSALKAQLLGTTSFTQIDKQDRLNSGSLRRRELSTLTPLIAGLLAACGGGGGGGVFPVADGSSPGTGGTSPGTGGATPSGPTPGGTTPQSVNYAASVVLGPLTDEGQGSTVILYKADGNKLGDAQYDTNTGKFTYTDSSGYTGTVIAVFVDGDSQPDHFDEATKTNKDIGQGTTLMAVFTPADGENVAFNINPLTTVAARKLQLDGKEQDGKLTNLGDAADSSKISSLNQNLAKAFGLSIGLTDGTVQPIFNTDGTSATGNDYGKVLAILSGVDVLTGGVSKTIEELLKTDSLTENADGSFALTDDAKEAFVQAAAIIELNDAQAANGLTNFVSKLVQFQKLLVSLSANAADGTVTEAEAQQGIKIWVQLPSDSLAGQKIQVLANGKIIAEKTLATGDLEDGHLIFEPSNQLFDTGENIEISARLLASSACSGGDGSERGHRDAGRL